MTQRQFFHLLRIISYLLVTLYRFSTAQYPSMKNKYLLFDRPRKLSPIHSLWLTTPPYSTMAQMSESRTAAKIKAVTSSHTWRFKKLLALQIFEFFDDSFQSSFSNSSLQHSHSRKFHANQKRILTRTIESVKTCEVDEEKDELSVVRLSI